MRWLLIVLVGFCTPSYGIMAPRVSVEVGVVDESGAPVEGATVRGDFAGVVSGEGSVERAQTDARGMATVTGRSFFPVGITADKNGYYPSVLKVAARDVKDGKEHYSDRRATVVLKEKRNPIALYAKRYSGEIPIAEEWVGFDLEKADWVAPHGRGATSDVLFRYKGYAKDFFDAQGYLDMKFPFPGDGMRDTSKEVDAFSQLRVPHEAPNSGYDTSEKRWSFRIGKGVSGSEYSTNKSKYYFMRVRTEADKDGAIIQSNYAKVYHDVGFDPRMKKNEKGVAWLHFTYYFNPTPNDRNLEFDPYRNLFKDLVHDEQVREP